MFTHDRSSWQDPKVPVAGPAFIPTRVDSAIVHYTAADDLIDGDPGESADDLPAYLRAIQRDYVTSRGYSIGYNVAVDWLGGSWELRGTDFRCAANKGHNEHTFAILVLVDGNDMATPQAAAEIRRIVGELEALCRRELAIVGHGQLTNPNAATACPGSGLRAQIALGEFSPRWSPPVVVPPPVEIPTPVPTPTEDDPMFYLTSPQPGTLPDLSWYAGKTYGISSVADAEQFLAVGAKRMYPSVAQFHEIVERSTRA